MKYKMTNMKYSELYCKIHRLKLIHNRIINTNKCKIEIGYCSKCQKEMCEFSDISDVYISNYEWLYNNHEYIKLNRQQRKQRNSLYGKFKF